MSLNWAKKGLCFLSIMLLASPAYALSTSFSSRASWDAAMVSQTTLDFTGFSSGGTNPTYHQYSFPLTYNGVTFNDTDIGYHPGRLFGMSPSYNGIAPYHTSEFLEWELAVNGNLLNITLPGAVSGIGFDYGMLYGNVGPFAIVLGNGDSFSVNSASNAYSFFGATTNTPFSSFSISAGGWMPYPIYDLPTIDNLSYGTAGANGSVGGGGTTSSVPEPSTFLLLGSGVIGLGMTRLRKFGKDA